MVGPPSAYAGGFLSFRWLYIVSANFTTGVYTIMSEEVTRQKMSQEDLKNQDVRDIKRKITFFIVCIILLLLGKFYFGY